jgi:hypothetical protein
VARAGGARGQRHGQRRIQAGEELGAALSGLGPVALGEARRGAGPQVALLAARDVVQEERLGLGAVARNSTATEARRSSLVSIARRSAISSKSLAWARRPRPSRALPRTALLRVLQASSRSSCASSEALKASASTVFSR